jgi:oxygen-independent coproporphyrinogen III oxidase
MIGVENTIALYIHVPFCERKCRYCSFISFALRQSCIPEYVKALKAEMKQKAENERVTSIFFGGGTPSLLSPEQIKDVLETTRSLYIVDKDAEITMEANPGTVDELYLSAVKKTGVNRLSLGIQSLKDKELSLLGRIHTAAEAVSAVKSARNAGFDNLNLDFIYGLPGQTVSDWREVLEGAIEVSPEHFSLYALTLEEDAPMYGDIEKKMLPEINPDLAADQYELAEDMLAAAGYKHYEISNWAKADYECRHNLVYWRNTPYLGIGVAAHSCLNGHRLANASDLDKYLADYSAGLPSIPEMDEEIPPELELAETVILGLRLDEGVNVIDIKNRFSIDVLSYYQHPIEEMKEAGLLEFTGNRLKLNRRGRLMSNEVFWRLLPEGIGISS